MGECVGSGARRLSMLEISRQWDDHQEQQWKGSGAHLCLPDKVPVAVDGRAQRRGCLSPLEPRRSQVSSRWQTLQEFTLLTLDLALVCL